MKGRNFLQATIKKRRTALLIFPVVLIVLLQVLPICLIAITSFKSPLALLAGDGVFTLSGFFTGNYVRVLFEDMFGQYVLTSTLIALGSTGLSLLFAAPAAYGLAKINFGFNGGLAFGVLCLRMIPPIVLALPIFVLFRFLGLNDSVFGLIIAHTTFNLPFAIWILVPFFEEIPKDYEEAASIDGLSRWQTFRYVTLPLSKTGLLVSSIFCFLMSWNDFLFSLILAGSSTTTAPLAINAYMTSDRVEWGPMTAASCLILVPAFFFCVYLQKHMIKGVNSGGVKG